MLYWLVKINVTRSAENILALYAITGDDDSANMIGESEEHTPAMGRLSKYRMFTYTYEYRQERGGLLLSVSIYQ